MSLQREAAGKYTSRTDSMMSLLSAPAAPLVTSTSCEAAALASGTAIESTAQRPKPATFDAAPRFKPRSGACLANVLLQLSRPHSLTVRRPRERARFHGVAHSLGATPDSRCRPPPCSESLPGSCCVQTPHVSDNIQQHATCWMVKASKFGHSSRLFARPQVSGWPLSEPASGASYLPSSPRGRLQVALPLQLRSSVPSRTARHSSFFIPQKRTGALPLRGLAWRGPSTTQPTASRRARSR